MIDVVLLLLLPCPFVVLPPGSNKGEMDEH
jgi:hypothetical protein